MRAIWPLLDPQALDASFEGWMIAALPIVTGQRETSARLAASYLTTFKALELGVGARPVTVLSSAPDISAVTTSLLVTGPVSVKRALLRAVPLARALATAESASAAAGMRHALDGGRQTLTESLRADSDASGWARVASGKACAFCSTLAGRVFPTDHAAFPAHDGCSCTAEPVYSAA